MKRYEELYNTDGSYKTDPDYKEIFKLHNMLENNNIPHTLHKMFDGWQIIYPEKGKKQVMDAIEHFGSYGSEQDLLEIMGLLTEEEEKINSVLGCLTAQDVFNRIYEHYISDI